VQSGEDVGSFADDAWSYNPGEAAFEPDLDEYHEQIAEAFRTERNQYQPPAEEDES
jgi:hypothetical protein